MGRFAESAPFYGHRKPYPDTFFAEVASRLQLSGTERLLDVGCGPGLLALGFAPFVAQVLGVDPEPAMIAAAREAAAARGISLPLVLSRFEDAPLHGPFEIVTLGRTIHWLDRDAAAARLAQLVSPQGAVVVVAAPTTEATPWAAAYREVRQRFSTEAESRYRVDLAAWFSGSPFQRVDEVRVRTQGEPTVAELVGRALSFSTTSPAVLGPRRAEFEEAIASALLPFAREGRLPEEVACVATVFRRAG